MHALGECDARPSDARARARAPRTSGPRPNHLRTVGLAVRALRHGPPRCGRARSCSCPAASRRGRRAARSTTTASVGGFEVEVQLLAFETEGHAIVAASFARADGGRRRRRRGRDRRRRRCRASAAAAADDDDDARYRRHRRRRSCVREDTDNDADVAVIAAAATAALAAAARSPTPPPPPPRTLAPRPTPRLPPPPPPKMTAPGEPPAGGGGAPPPPRPCQSRSSASQPACPWPRALGKATSSAGCDRSSLQLGAASAKTRVKNRVLDAVFDETFELDVVDARPSLLVVEVWDDDSLLDKLGFAQPRCELRARRLGDRRLSPRVTTCARSRRSRRRRAARPSDARPCGREHSGGLGSVACEIDSGPTLLPARLRLGARARRPAGRCRLAPQLEQAHAYDLAAVAEAACRGGGRDRSAHSTLSTPTAPCSACGSTASRAARSPGRRATRAARAPAAGTTLATTNRRSQNVG